MDVLGGGAGQGIIQPTTNKLFLKVIERQAPGVHRPGLETTLCCFLLCDLVLLNHPQFPHLKYKANMKLSQGLL